MSKPNLLVELFVEELPPKALGTLGEAFAGALLAQLQVQRLASTESVLSSFASPRRLAAHITNVVVQAPDKAQSQKLMPVAVGLDTDGNATPALLKKLAALGADASAVANLKRRVDGKAEALVFESTVRGASLAEGLQQALREAIAKLPIPKIMSYQLESNCELPGWSSVSFVRPAHGLVALHGAEVVAVEALGLKAGRETHGHRFEAAVDPIVLRDADSYAEQLRDQGAVIASFDARHSEIARQLTAAAEKIGGGARAIDDDALLDEVTALVERPNVLACAFDPAFLEVPSECLILTMKANQKYFPLLDPAGKLTNRFLVVSNITPDDPSAVIEGNERVVRSRLADAKFFYDQDRKKTLGSRVAALDKVVYHNKLGTQGERALRVEAIARAIALKLGDEALAQHAAEAARLAKADLVTDMVGEFPELQGTMGRYYALHDGLAPEIADSIEDHYKPRFAGDSLPRGQVGVVVALADKLETLVGMFGIGNLPTGDRDPFALRRHALGVVRMLVERALPLQFHVLTRLAFDAFPAGLLQDAAVALDEFLIERLKGYLKEAGHAPNEIDAAIHAQKLGLWSTIPQRLDAVRAFAALPEAPALVAANKRIGNILKKASEAAGAADAHVDPALFREPAEASLHETMQEVLPQANALFEAGDYTASLQTLAQLRGAVDEFFDGVMVNTEESDLRLNRLGLLASLHRAMNRVALLERLAA